MTVDVVIVGAGITGLTTALLLKNAGYKVAVIEAKTVGAGTTGGTSAHLSTIWDEGYPELINSQGLVAGRAVATLMSDAIDRIESICIDNHIECNFERVSGFLYADDVEGETKVEEVFKACQRLGLPVFRHGEAPLPFKTWRTVEVQNQAQFQPLRYLQGIAKKVAGEGSYVCENSRVTDFSEAENCIVHVGGHRIQSANLVLATHVPLGISPLQSQVAPYRSYLIAFKPKIRRQFPSALYWDTATPYHYIRTFTAGNSEIVLVGGKDRKTAHGDEAQSFKELRDYVRERFDVLEICHEWSAQFYIPADRLPFIGVAPWQKKTYLATGFSGDGLTLGTAAAEMITNQIDHRAPRLPLSYFSPSRINVKGLKRFAEENIDVAKNFFKDRFTGAGQEQIRHLQNGEGCIVKSRLSHIAVYRSETGDLSRFDAVCPHLKCIVHWNRIQKTFDCPCHGSRFDVSGQVLEGPSLEGLSRWQD